MEINNLKKLRLEKGLTQKQLCEELKKINCYIDRSTYAKLESGKRKYFHDAIIKLAIFFDTSIDYILGCTDDRTPPTRSREAEEFLNVNIRIKKEAAKKQPREENRIPTEQG